VLKRLPPPVGYLKPILRHHGDKCEQKMAKQIEAGLKIKAGVEGAETLRQLADEIEAMGGDTAQLREQSKSLGEAWQRVAAQQALIARFRELKTESRGLADELAATQANINTLAQRMQADPSAALRRQFDAATQKAARLKDKQSELQQSLQRVRNEMRAAELPTRNLHQEQARLGEAAKAAEAKLHGLTVEAQRLKATAAARVRLGLDVDDRVRREITATTAAYRLLRSSGTLTKQQLARATELYKARLRELKAELDGVPGKMSPIASSLKGLGTAGLAAAGVGGGLFAVKEGVQAILDKTQEFQQIRKRLDYAFGGAEEGGKQLDFVRGVVERLGLDMVSAANGYAQLAAATKDEDFIETLFVANTHDYLMCFTNHGRCHWIKVYKLPEGGRNSRGRPINNVIQLDENEKVSAILPVRDFPEDEYVFFATAMGIVKKVQLSAFKNVSKVGIKAIALKEGDSLVGVARTSGSNDIMLFSNLGKAIRFNEYWERSSDDEETGDDNDTEISGSQEDDSAESAPISGKHGVRPSGRGSGGLRGMRLPENGRIVSLITFAPECEQSELQVLTATANGYGKRTPIASYSRKNKGGQGNIAINTGERNGDLVAATLVSESDDLMLITSGGVLIRTKVEQIRETGRAAAGVKLINLDEGETLVSLERVAEEEEDEAQAAETQTSAESPSQEQGEA